MEDPSRPLASYAALSGSFVGALGAFLVAGRGRLGLWLTAALSVGVVLRPREARFVCSVLAAHAIADGLNAGFVRLKPPS